MTASPTNDGAKGVALAPVAGRRATSARIRAVPMKPNVVPLRESKTHCTSCSLAGRCLPFGLVGDEVSQLDELVGPQRRLRKGEVLVHPGAPFHALYAIRWGSVKTSILAEDGREQVAGFHMPGEFVGLDGIAPSSHTCAAVALEDTEVCAVPYDRLEDLAHGIPALRHNVRQMLAQEVSRNHSLMLLLGSMRAEERVASYLLDLSERYRQRGYSASEFVLRMTREEIGSYLGLKLETVSRVFSRLQAEGLIQAQGREVKLLDPPMLNRLLGRDCAGPPV